MIFVPKLNYHRSEKIRILRKLKIQHTRWNLFVLYQISQNIDSATWELILEVFDRAVIPEPEIKLRHEREISYDTIRYDIF